MNRGFREAWIKILGYPKGTKVRLLQDFFTGDDMFVSHGEIGIVIRGEKEWYSVVFDRNRFLILHVAHIEGVE